MHKQQTLIAAAVQQADHATKIQLSQIVAMAMHKLKLSLDGSEAPLEAVDVGEKGTVTSSIGGIVTYIKAIRTPDQITTPPKPHTYDTDEMAKRHYDRNLVVIKQSKGVAEQACNFLKSLAVSLKVDNDLIERNGAPAKKVNKIDAESRQALANQGTLLSQQLTQVPVNPNAAPGTVQSQQVVNVPAPGIVPGA